MAVSGHLSSSWKSGTRSSTSSEGGSTKARSNATTLAVCADASASCVGAFCRAGAWFLPPHAVATNAIASASRTDSWCHAAAAPYSQLLLVVDFASDANRRKRRLRRLGDPLV